MATAGLCFGGRGDELIPISARGISMTNKLEILDSKTKKVKVKVKCTLVQALRLCTGRMAHGVSRGIAQLFLDHGTRRG